jgi:anti-anti-sigma regulatory factor
MLTINIENVQARVPVTIAHLTGELDASSYKSLIDKADELYAGGTRDLLLDLSQLTFMSSTGLVALHSTALVMRGEKLPDGESGWDTFHAIARDVEAGSAPEEHLKILSPQTRVKKTLEISGFSQIISIFEDQDEALASY